MSGANITVWSDVAVSVQTALGAAKVITGITKANPAVAHIVGHGHAVGEMIWLKVNGMTQLNNTVKRVLAVVDVDHVSLEDVDSTLFRTFTSGTSEEVTFGAGCATLQDINASGGEVKPIDATTIHDSEDQEIPGNRSALVYNFGSIWDPEDPALKAMAAFDNIKTPGCLEFIFANGTKLYFAAFMSANLAAQGQAGGVVTTPVSFRIRGRMTSYAAA